MISRLPLCLSIVVLHAQLQHSMTSIFSRAVFQSQQLLARLIRLTSVLERKKEKRNMERKNDTRGGCLFSSSGHLAYSPAANLHNEDSSDQCIMKKHCAVKNTSRNIDARFCDCKNSICTVHNRVCIIYPIVFLIHQPCSESSYCCIKGEHEEIDRWGGETLNIADFFTNYPSIIVGHQVRRQATDTHCQFP